MFYVLFTYSKGNKERDFRGFRSENDLIDFLHLEYERIDIVQIISVEKSYRLGLIETEELAKSALFEKKIEIDLPDPAEEKIGETGEKMEEAEPGEPLTGEKKSFMEEIIDETEAKEALKIPDEAILEPGEKDDRSSKKHPYLKNRKNEPSAMEKIADEIEEEMTADEIEKKNKKLLERGDEAMAAAEKDLEKTTGFIPKPVVEEIKRGYKRKKDHEKDWPKCPECNRRKIAPWNKSGRCSHCQQYKKIPKKLKLDKTDWQTCPKCGTRKIAPWSKTGICSYCQGNRGKKK